jgi:hypothetical protein
MVVVSHELEFYECCICMDMIVDEITLDCHHSHQFHSRCLIQHMSYDQRCPCCRTDINGRYLRSAARIWGINRRTYPASSDAPYELREFIENCWSSDFVRGVTESHVNKLHVTCRLNYILHSMMTQTRQYQQFLLRLNNETIHERELAFVYYDIAREINSSSDEENALLLIMLWCCGPDIEKIMNLVDDAGWYFMTIQLKRLLNRRHWWHWWHFWKGNPRKPQNMEIWGTQLGTTVSKLYNLPTERPNDT